MSSSLLVVVGVTGLVICGAVRLLPYLKGLALPAFKGNDTHKVVDAFVVLHEALLAVGETEQANLLRTKTLPAAIQTKESGA